LKKKIAFVVYYHKHNFYSMNALVGALETQEDLKDLPVYFIKEEDHLVSELEVIISNHEIIIVGISFFTTQLFEIRDLIITLRTKFQGKSLFIAGGPHPTGDPIGTLKLGFDIVVVGEGEETLIELMRKIDLGVDYNNIKGIAYLNKSDEHILTGKRELIDLDEYPPFPLINTRYGAIEITRGCPYACYFCQIPHISGTKPRHRSIKVISKYVRVLRDFYGDQTDIRFITPNSFGYGSPDGKTLNMEKIEELLHVTREIIGNKAKIFFGTFPSEVRPEHVSKETINLILKYANNDNITIGAQSGSQKILDACHRGHTIDDVYKAVEITLKSNLEINVDFIFGLPGEEEEDINLSLNLMKNLAEMGAKIHAHSFIPLPQTPFAKAPISRTNLLYKKEIQKLNSKGLAFGDWEKQDKLAVKISQYLNKDDRIK
jgi:B12-binding domain/radical SAM domain protein